MYASLRVCIVLSDPLSSLSSQLTATADYLARQIVAIKNGELFELLSDGNGNGLPLVAWKLKGEQKYDGESQLEFTFQHYI